MTVSSDSRFTGLVRFTYGPDSGCGGLLNLRGNNRSVSLSSPDVNNDGKYEPGLNCQWLVVGRGTMNVRMHFNSFDVERTENVTDITCWDYVEVTYTCTRLYAGKISTLYNMRASSAPPQHTFRILLRDLLQIVLFMQGNPRIVNNKSPLVITAKFLMLLSRFHVKAVPRGSRKMFSCVLWMHLAFV